MAALTFFSPTVFPEVGAGDVLAALIISALEAERVDVGDGDVFVVAQKVVSKSEGRQRRLCDVDPSQEAYRLARLTGKDPRVVELVLQESRAVVRCRPGVLIVRDVRGFVLANAGIDASNVVAADAEETVLLLPEDPDASAALLRGALMTHFGVQLGVIINDSWGRAWRKGTVGTAIGVSGLPGLLDMRGMPDRQGRRLVTTEVGIADELASGASVLMGQANEGRPIVLVKGFTQTHLDGSARDLIRTQQEDLFP